MTDKTSAEKTFKCARCGKQKHEGDGLMIWGGSTFCCKICCDKAQEEKSQEGVCEFC